MFFETRKAALASLHEFAPYMRSQHMIVRYWSEVANKFRYCRVMKGTSK